MKKKTQKSKTRKPKLLKLNKETVYLLESSDLAHVVGGTSLSRSSCATIENCCVNW